MLSVDNQKKLDKFIKEKFNIIFEYNFKGRVLLYGGAVRNTLIDEKINDLDFVILTQDECEIPKFIKKYDLKYKFNMHGGYKIFYNDVVVDIYSTNDLCNAGKYNIDMLFYDVINHVFIPCGYINAIDNRKIIEQNLKEPFVFYLEKVRLKKLVDHVKHATKNSKKVKVKCSVFRWRQLEIKRKLTKLKKNLRNGNFRKCFRFLEGRKKEFIIIIFLGLLLTGISVLTPMLSGNLITKILYGGYKTSIFIVSMLVVLKVISILLSFYLSKLYLIIKKKMVFNIRKEICKTVLNFELTNFNNNNSGAFVNKLKDDPNDITRTFNKIKDILISGVGNFGVLLYIFYLNFGIGLIFFIFMIIVFKIKMRGIREKTTAKRDFLKEQERYSSLLNEMINGMSDIKTLNLKDTYEVKTTESVQSALETEYNGDYAYNKYNKLANLLKFTSIGIIIVYGLFLIKKDLLDPSTLIIIYMYKSSIYTFLDRFMMLMDVRAEFNLSCNRIFSLLDDNVFLKETYGSKEKQNCLGLIEFRDVDFRYGQNQVLKKCSFKVGKNETIAIVGKSGSGKTTILNLISKTRTTSDGNIYIDGIDINELSESYIRNNISVISQNPYLFDMSIKDNLRLVDENISDKQVEDVCKLVCMDKFIQTLPNKYDTIIGEGGVKLSGGQKQRLGIARALIKKTKIILLDEITSALDNDTASAIKRVIKNIRKNHTVIIVTHELSMIEDCSRVLVLDKGKIVADDNHLQLIKNNRTYKKLYKLK